MHVFAAPLDRIIGNRHLRARLLAATPKPYDGTLPNGMKITWNTDLYIFLTDDRIKAPMLREHDAIVATERGQVLGWGFLWPPEPEWRLDDRVYRLLSLVVVPEYRRRGIGSRIVDAARRVANGVPIIGSAAAEAFFRRHGMLPSAPCRAT